MGPALLMQILPMIAKKVDNAKASLVGGIKGVSQLIQARQAKKRADSFMPEYTDPSQLAFLAELNQKRKSLNAGSEFAADMGYIDQTAAGTNQAITQVGGGDVSGTMQALLGAQRNADRAKNQVLAAGDQQQQFYSTFASDLTNKIAQRRMELQLANASQARAEWAQGKQDAYANLANAYARTDGGSGNIDFLDILKRHGGKVGNTGAPEAPQYISSPKPELENIPEPTPIRF